MTREAVLYQTEGARPNNGVEDRSFGEITVRPSEPILVGDVTSLLYNDRTPADLAREVTLLAATTMKDGARYIDASTLAPETTALVERALTDAVPERTVIVFPGEGSLSVLRESLPDQSCLAPFRCFPVPARRIVDKGKVLGVSLEPGRDLTDTLSDGDVDTVVVVDDCIATGSTVNAVRAMVTKQSKKQSLRFRAVTWFCRQPTNATGYDVDAIVRYASQEGCPALQSLSTLLGNDAKSAAVRDRFRRRFSSYDFGFDKQLAEIRNLFNFDKRKGES